MPERGVQDFLYQRGPMTVDNGAKTKNVTGTKNSEHKDIGSLYPRDDQRPCRAQRQEFSLNGGVQVIGYMTIHHRDNLIPHSHIPRRCRARPTGWPESGGLQPCKEGVWGKRRVYRDFPRLVQSWLIPESPLRKYYENYYENPEIVITGSLVPLLANRWK